MNQTVFQTENYDIRQRKRSIRMKNLTAKEKRTSFADFCENEGELFLISLAHIVSCIPEAMNKRDNRFDISNFYCHELERDFAPVLIEDQSIGYDMRYNKKDRISIKSQKKVFQHVKKSLALGRPGALVIRNYLTTVNRTAEVSGFDYLLAIERNVDAVNGRVSVGFGVARPETVQKYIVPSKTDQLRTQIPNDAWDYFSGVETFDLDVDERKQNRRYYYAKGIMFDLLRGIV